MPLVPFNVRVPEELKIAAKTEADRLGLTQSEFARMAFAMAIAWHRALDTVEEGGQPKDLRDPDVAGRILADE